MPLCPACVALLTPGQDSVESVIKAASQRKRCKHTILHSTRDHLRTVFEKTCEATQKNVKSHVFWILKKKRKKRTGRPTQRV